MSTREGICEVSGDKKHILFVHKLMMSTNKTNLDTPAHVGQAQEKRPKVQRTEKSVWLIDVPSEGVDRVM